MADRFAPSSESVDDRTYAWLRECYDVLAELMEWNHAVVGGEFGAPAWRQARQLQRKLAGGGYA